MMWYLIDDGSTIDTVGSENRIIVKDEEYEFGARITLEKDVNRCIPFAITCGIYGLMAHTVYCSDSEKDMKYKSIKQDIEKLIKELDDDNTSELVEEFVNKY